MIVCYNWVSYNNGGFMELSSFLTNHNPEELKDYVFYEHENKIYLDEKGVLSNLKRFFLVKFDYDYNLLSIIDKIRGSEYAKQLNQDWTIAIDNIVFNYASQNKLDVPTPITCHDASIVKTAEIFARIHKPKTSTALIDGKWKKLGFTPKTYAFTNGDTFIAGTGLEGGNVQENIHLILRHYENRDFSNKEEVISLLKSFSSTDSPDLSERIKKLQPGQKILVNGGWTTHAILYIVEKTEDGKFAFSAVNTGAGINNFHQSQDLGLKVKYKPLVRIHQIDEAMIINPEIWKAFSELKIKTKADGTLWEHSADDIYSRILPALQGKRDLDFENGVDFITDQRGGTCSWKAVMKLISVVTGEISEYKKENFLFRYLSNVEFNDYLLHSENPSNEDIQLLKKGSENFVRYALKLLDDGVISEKDSKEVSTLKDKIDSTIKEVAQRQKVQPIAIKPDEHLPLKETLGASFFQTDSASPRIVNEQDRFPEGLYVPKLDSFPQTFGDLKQRWDDLNDASMKLGKASQFRGSLRLITEFVASGRELLQIGKLEKLCEGQSGAEIEKLIECVYELHERVLFHIAAIPKHERMTPDHLALMTILGVLNNKLMQQLPDELCPIKKGFMPVPVEFFWIIEEEPFAVIQNKQLAIPFFQAGDYLRASIQASSDNSWQIGNWFEFVYSFSLGKLNKNDQMLELLKRIQMNNAQLAGLTDRELISKALTTFGDPSCPLPKWFQSLLKQYFLYECIQEDPDLTKTEFSAIHIKFTQDIRKDYDCYSLDFFGCMDPFDMRYRVDFRKKYNAQFLFQQTGFKRKGLQDILKQWRGLPSEMKSFHTYNAESNSSVLMEAKEGLTRQETQALTYYCSNNQTIIPNLIAYFSEHFDKLADSDYQKFLEIALFSGEHLTDTLKNSPKVVKKLDDFLVHQYRLHKGLGNVQPQLFFLRIMEDLNRLTKNSSPELYIKHELEMLAAKQEVKSLKALIYQQWIASYHDWELNEEDIIKLAKAYVYVNVYGSGEHVSDPSIIDNSYRTMDHVFTMVGKLSEESQTRIISESLQESLSEKPGGEYSLDLNSLTIFKGANPIGGLPYQIFQDPDFIEIFGREIFTATSSSPGVYEFKASTGMYRVFFSAATQKLKIQKNIEGGWHTYVKNDQLGKLFSTVALNRGYFHWVASTAPPHMILEKKEDHRVHSKIIFEPINKTEYKIAAWQKYDHQIGEYSVRLNQLSGEQVSFLDRFQPKDTILLWDDTIEFSSLGLEFNKKGEKYLYSKDPNYHLSQKQIPPGCLEHFSGYLRIVNDKGKVQYLIPQALLKKDISGALQRGISINTNTNDFMIFKEKNGKLIAKTAEEYLFLAYLHIAHKNYAEADEALQDYNAGKPQGYGEAENKIMDWIYDYLKFAKDESPEGIAIALQAISLHIRNLSSEERLKNKTKIGEMAARLLIQYYPLAQHARKYQLKPTQEKELLEFCGFSSEILVQRNQQIASFSAEVKPPEFDTVSAYSIQNELDSAAREEVANLYLNGGKKIASCFDDIFSSIISKDPQIRLKAYSELLLLKIPDNSHLNKIRSIFLLIAKHGNDEIRQKLSESLSCGRLDKLNSIISAYSEIKEMNILPEKVVPISTNLPEKALPMNLKVLEINDKVSGIAKAGFKPSHAYIPPAYSIMNVFAYYEMKLEKANPEQIDNSHLINTFSSAGKTASRVAKKEFEIVSDSIRSYTDKVNSSEIYSISDSQLETMTSIFDDIRNYLLEEAEVKKTEIEKLLSKEPSDFRENMIYRLQVHGQVKKTLTVDDLMVLYLQNNTEELLKQNPHLTAEDLSKLTELLTHYLVNMTECDYFKNLQKASATAFKETGEVKEKALNDLNTLIRSERSYDVQTDRILLIYEYSSGFRLRSDQIAIIRSMTINDPSKINNYIMQLIMGSGKSKVILPLLAYLNSRGDNIPIIITPDALSEIQLEDTRIFSGQYLRQERETIVLKEGEQIGAKDIDKIIKKLERVKERRSYLLVNPSVIHSLRLYADSVYCELSETENPSPELISKYSKIKKVMTMLKNEGDAIIDEADLVLSCRKETNLARGDWENINQDTQDIIEDVFTSIINNPELNRYIKVEREAEAAFDESDYQDNIKPKLVPLFIDIALKEGMVINDQQRKEVENYLLSKKELIQIPNVIAIAPPRAQAALAIGKEMIKTLLPLLMTNYCDVNFGLSKKTKSNQAIPYAASNSPSEGSLFGTPYESLIYTMAYYTRKGLSADQINHLINQLKSEAFRECKAKKIPLEETESFRKFQDLQLVPTKNLFTVQEGELVDALNIFNAKVENRIRFARQFGWIEVKFNPEKYSSNAQDLVGTFHSNLGFSGTLLHNKDTLHRSLIPKLDPSVIGMTLSLLHHSGSKVRPFANLESFIKSLANYSACIDIGSWFRGINALDVAKKIFDVLPPKMKGIAYINDVDIPPGTKDQQVILLRGATKPILLSQSKLKPDERFTYYNVITGVDILQDEFATAIATISETTILRDVEQGMWRMRGVGRKQIVDLAVWEELAVPRTPEGVAVFCTQNQAAIKEKDNPHALLQKIQHEIKALLEAVLRNENLSAQEAGAISAAGRELIVKLASQDPAQVFGGVSSKTDIKTIVNAQIEQALNYAKTKLYDKFPIFEATLSYQTLENRIVGLPNYEVLPEEDYWQSSEKGQGAQPNYGVKTQTKLKTDTKTKTKTQLRVNAIEDRIKTGSGIMDSDTYWHTIVYENLFSYKVWEALDYGPYRVFGSVNRYLQKDQDSLFNYDSQQPIFSENLGMSFFYRYSTGDFDDIPFQTGTKPEGICSLRINRKTGEMGLDFLHPNEANFLWKMLDSESNYIQNKKDEYLKNIEIAESEFYDEAKKEIFKILHEHNPSNDLNLEDIEKILKKIHWRGAARDQLKYAFKNIGEIGNLEIIIPSLWKKKVGRIRDQKIDAFLRLSQAEDMFGNEKDFDLFLINPSTGVVKAGNDDIDEEVLKQNPEYHKLMAQAKFYHGKLDDYTPQEAEYLKKWAKEVGVERLESFLLNNIFRTKAEERDLYENSFLKQIFAEAAVSLHI